MQRPFLPEAPAPRRLPCRSRGPEPYDYVGWLRGSEGAALRYGVAHPRGAPTGSVLLLQGRSECLEKYREIISGLTARGLTVYCFDWHGQGFSDRTRPGRRSAEVHSFDDYLDDLGLFLREVWCRPEPNRFLIGNSTGGHVALRYMAERGLDVAGTLLLAPMIDIRTRGFPRWFAPMLASSMVRAGLGDYLVPGERRLLPSVRRFEGNALTSDPARFRILPDLVKANPDLERRCATYRWVNAAFRSIDRLNRPGVAESIASPVTMLLGSDDCIIDTDAVRAFAERLPRGRVKVLEGARHEIMMENDRLVAEFWREVDGLMEGPEKA